MWRLWGGGLLSELAIELLRLFNLTRNSARLSPPPLSLVDVSAVVACLIVTNVSESSELGVEASGLWRRGLRWVK